MTYFTARIVTLVFVLFSLSACNKAIRKPDETAVMLQRLEQRLDSQAQEIATVNAGIEMLKVNQDSLDFSLSELQQAVDELNSSAEQPEPVLVQVASDASSDEPQHVIDSSAADEAPKMILGRAEWLWLEQSERYVKAYVDTSVEYSMILAEEIVQFERDGKKWVRAEVSLGDEIASIEAPVMQNGRVRAYSAGSSRKGPVVSLMVRLANFADEIAFVAVERKKSAYPLSLGRNFLTDIAIVDVAKKFVQKRDRAMLENQKESEAAEVKASENE